MKSDEDAPVTARHLEDKLVGYVKYKFLIMVMLGTIATPIVCTWMLVESHANKSHHAGAVSNQQFMEFKADYRSDMGELKDLIGRVLDFHLHNKD